MAIALTALLSGCASVTGTTNQSVSVQTREQGGKDTAGAACELANSKGKWFITTPGSVTVTRSHDDMQVLCTKLGFEPGRASVVSGTKGPMFGNIIPNPHTAPAPTVTASRKDQLKELKRLSDAGLISKEAYLDQQRVILSK